MKLTDYDTEQYQDYARGRALKDEQMAAWIGAFGALLPEGRPLVGLDVGSGTGRFAPALASAFGPVTGVEPSVRMREVALAQSQHPDVQYVAGSAEDVPTTRCCCCPGTTCRTSRGRHENWPASSSPADG